MNRWIAPVLVLSVGLLITVGALVAGAKEPRDDSGRAAAGESIGSVDIEDVYNASALAQDLDQAAHGHEAEGAQRINKIMAVPYLEHAELEEYGTLIGKAKQDPEEEKRAAALKSTNDERAAELRGLETKQNAALTAEDKTRMSHLNDLKQTLQNQVRPGLVADFRQQQEGWIADYRHRQILTLRQEVAKVAKEKGIANVFDAGSLVYSVNDLTPIVLQRVAKRGPRRGNP